MTLSLRPARVSGRLVDYQSAVDDEKDTQWSETVAERPARLEGQSEDGDIDVIGARRELGG